MPRLRRRQSVWEGTLVRGIRRCSLTPANVSEGRGKDADAQMFHARRQITRQLFFAANFVVHAYACRACAAGVTRANRWRSFATTATVREGGGCVKTVSWSDVVFKLLVFHIRKVGVLVMGNEGI